MANTSFQMFITTFLLASPSDLNRLLSTGATIDDFAKEMGKTQFHVDAITRAKTDLFPNLEQRIPDALLQVLRAQTNLRGVLAQLGTIIQTQLASLYGGGTIHPTSNEATLLTLAAKLADGAI